MYTCIKISRQLTTGLFNRFKYIRTDIYHADLGMNNILSSTTTMHVVLWLQIFLIICKIISENVKHNAHDKVQIGMISYVIFHVHYWYFV